MRLSKKGAADCRVYESTSIGGLDRISLNGVDIAVAENHAESESVQNPALFYIVTSKGERVSTFRNGRRVRSARI